MCYSFYSRSESGLAVYSPLARHRRYTAFFDSTITAETMLFFRKSYAPTRALGVKRNPLPCPKTIQELHDMVSAQPPPPPQQPLKCKGLFEQLLQSASLLWGGDILRNGCQNRYSYDALAPLSLEPKMKFEPMVLAHSVVKYFDQPKERLNDVQLAALDELLEWIDVRKRAFLCRKSAHTRYCDLICGLDLELLLSWINELFFGVKNAPMPILWNGKLGPHCPARVAKRPYNNSSRFCIEMNPNFLQVHTSENLMLHFLGTLLHEAAHVFEGMHTDRQPEHDMGTKGHGASWQIIAAGVERTFLRLTGVPVNLGRWESIRAHWHKMARLPNKQELIEWHLQEDCAHEDYLDHLFQGYCRVGGWMHPLVSSYNMWVHSGH